MDTTVAKKRLKVCVNEMFRSTHFTVFGFLIYNEGEAHLPQKCDQNDHQLYCVIFVDHKDFHSCFGDFCAMLDALFSV